MGTVAEQVAALTTDEGYLYRHLKTCKLSQHLEYDDAILLAIRTLPPRLKRRLIQTVKRGALEGWDRKRREYELGKAAFQNMVHTILDDLKMRGHRTRTRKGIKTAVEDMHNTYTIEQKCAIANQVGSVQSVGRNYGVSEGQVIQWRAKHQWLRVACVVGMGEARRFREWTMFTLQLVALGQGLDVAALCFDARNTKRGQPMPARWRRGPSAMQRWKRQRQQDLWRKRLGKKRPRPGPRSRGQPPRKKSKQR